MHEKLKRESKSALRQEIIYLCGRTWTWLHLNPGLSVFWPSVPTSRRKKISKGPIIPAGRRGREEGKKKKVLSMWSGGLLWPRSPPLPPFFHNTEIEVVVGGGTPADNHQCLQYLSSKRLRAHIAYNWIWFALPASVREIKGTHRNPHDSFSSTWQAGPNRSWKEYLRRKNLGRAHRRLETTVGGNNEHVIIKTYIYIYI